MRWLAGKTHELRKYEWGPMPMGRAIDTLEANMGWAIDTLEAKMVELSVHPSKVVDKTFMMGFFQKFIEELPPFADYWDMMFKRKQMAVVSRKDGTKVVHLARLQSQLFSPTRRTV